MLMPHLASDKDGPSSSLRAGAVFFDTGAKRYSSFLDHELRRPYFAGFGTKTLVNDGLRRAPSSVIVRHPSILGLRE